MQFNIFGFENAFIILSNTQNAKISLSKKYQKDEPPISIIISSKVVKYNLKYSIASLLFYITPNCKTTSKFGLKFIFKTASNFWIKITEQINSKSLSFPGLENYLYEDKSITWINLLKV